MDLVPDRKNSRIEQKNFPLRNSRGFYSTPGDNWILLDGTWDDTGVWRDQAEWNDG